MDEDVIEELRAWLRANLLIEVDATDPSGPENSVFVGIRLAEDKDCFTRQFVYIPDRDV